MQAEDGSATEADVSPRAIWRVVLPYAVFAGLWIILSDRALELLVGDGARSAWLQTLKGWFFVLITSLLLYGLVRSMLRRIIAANAAQHEAQRRRIRALGLLDAVVSTSTDAIFAKDVQGRYLLFNRAAAGFTGKVAERVLGRDDNVLFAADEAAQVMANDQLVMARGEIITFEEDLDTPEGKVTFQATKGPLRGADGSVIGMFGISRDITAIKAARIELRKLSKAVEQSPVGIVITGLDGRIEYANAAFEKQGGFAPGEVLGMDASEPGSVNTPPSIFAELRDALARGKGWRGEFTNVRKDGSTYVVAASIVPIRRSDGQIINYLSVQEDISERKRIAAELEHHRLHLEELVASRTAALTAATARAESASQAKSAFLANMSHEIRTPMNAIIGLTHLLRENAPAPHQRDRLARIDGAAHHLLSIINGILDLSKIESGHMSLERVAFSLAAALDNVQAQVAEQVRSKGLGLIVDVDQQVPDRLRGDETRLRQALLNYVVNAVKFSEQGDIVLRVSLVEDRGETLMLRFSVQDQGIGIDLPDETLPRLFEAFEQLDASTSRRYGGTGLGLAITRRLAGLMGGHVGVTKNPEGGATFWFIALLQRAQATAGAHSSAVTESSTQRLRETCLGKRVLLADADPVGREVVAELLKEAALEVDAVGDGDTVLRLASNRRYDLILMDVQMQGLSGLDATRRLRAIAWSRHTPIVAMTAGVFEGDRQACFDAGMDDFVAKPVEPQHLFSVVLRWLAGDDGSLHDPAASAVLEAAPTELPDSSEKEPLIGQMREYLLGSDMRANALLERQRRQFSAMLASDFSAFSGFIGAFRYPEALALMDGVHSGADTAEERSRQPRV